METVTCSDQKAEFVGDGYFPTYWPYQPERPWDLPGTARGLPYVIPPDYTNDWVWREGWGRRKGSGIDPVEPARWISFPDRNQYRIY